MVFPQFFLPCLESVLDSQSQGDILPIPTQWMAHRPSEFESWVLFASPVSPLYKLLYKKSELGPAMEVKFHKDRTGSELPQVFYYPHRSSPLHSDVSVQISWIEKWDTRVLWSWAVESKRLGYPDLPFNHFRTLNKGWPLWILFYPFVKTRVITIPASKNIKD